MSTDCPICCTPTGTVCFIVDSYPIYSCSGCGHQYLEECQAPPETLYNDAYFTSGKSGYPDYHQESQLLRNHGQWYAKQLSKKMAPGQMLDVGAAAGYILQGFIDEGWTGVGIEPNQTMVEYGQKELGLKMRKAFLEDIDPREKFDLVNLIQVLAHFYDLPKAMKKIAQLTRPGGYLLIETWIRDSLTAKLFGVSWHEYSPPSVRHWFTRNELSSLAKKYGFEQIASGRPKKRISGEHARSLLKHKSINNQILKLIPRNLTLPYPFDDIYWVLFKYVI